MSPLGPETLVCSKNHTICASPCVKILSMTTKYPKATFSTSVHKGQTARDSLPNYIWNGLTMLSIWNGLTMLSISACGARGACEDMAASPTWMQSGWWMLQKCTIVATIQQTYKTAHLCAVCLHLTIRVYWWKQLICRWRVDLHSKHLHTGTCELLGWFLSRNALVSS